MPPCFEQTTNVHTHKPTKRLHHNSRLQHYKHELKFPNRHCRKSNHLCAIDTHLWRLERVVAREVDVKKEHSPMVR